MNLLQRYLAQLLGAAINLLYSFACFIFLLVTLHLNKS